MLKCFVVYVVVYDKFVLILWLDLGRKSIKNIQIFCHYHSWTMSQCPVKNIQ